MKTLKEVEIEHILKSLYENDGNVMKTAKDLGVSVRGLRLKIVEIRKLGSWTIPCRCQFGVGSSLCKNHEISNPEPL